MTASLGEGVRDHLNYIVTTKFFAMLRSSHIIRVLISGYNYDGIGNWNPRLGLGLMYILRLLDGWLQRLDFGTINRTS